MGNWPFQNSRSLCSKEVEDLLIGGHLTGSSSKGKGPCYCHVRQSPRLAVGASDFSVREMFLASAIRAAQAIDARQRFPETSPLRMRLRVQTQEEDHVTRVDNGSAFPEIEKVFQDIVFVAVEHLHASEELGEGLGGDGGDSDDEFFEREI